MQTNAIKRFATEARNKLKEGIAAKIRTLGFDKKGNVAEEHRPQLMQGGTHWNGQLLPETFYHQWTSLYHRIQQKGISEVYEEAAYTWFNRLCAIRILQKNDLCAPVLDYTDAARTPFIVDEARQGRIPEMNNEMRSRLSDLLDDDTKVTEQFAVLINAWCHDNPIIHSCFGAMADYTELLLPNNILTEGGFVDMLNHTDFITDADYRSPELIGWLYQFYISERKDEVFAKKGKFEADEIPAATQIFTPNWIVKYMVQNTVGRIYLDNNPYETQLQKKWKYLINNVQCTMYNESATPAKPIINSTLSIINYSELEELKVGDLACGSGHILNECFDLLYDLYIAEGYGRGEAIENIFRHNLTGVDLDTRAKQLATFALLLKACQKDNAFADAHCLPRVLDMTGIVPNMNEQELSDACLHFMGGYEGVAGEMLEQDFELLRDADNLGSIMMFNDDEDYLAMLRYHYDDWTDGDIEDCPEDIKVLIPGVRLILALSEKYHALVMNPPYMGGGNMNATLSKYVKWNYEEGKADLFSVFMLLAIDRLLPNGKYGMINMQSWMFLSSFEKLRTSLLTENRIDNMLHLGPRTFDELSGEVVQNTAFVITNCEGRDATGSYYRLIEGKNCGDKERMFLEAQENGGNRIYYPNVSQHDFEKIPGCPIGYWVSEKMIEAFSYELINTYATPRAGLATGDNNTFQRLWYEVSFQNIGFNVTDCNETLSLNTKWYPCLSGGRSRKWGGHIEYIVNWQNNGYDLKHFVGSNGKLASRPQNTQFYFKEGLTWNKISSNEFCVRYKSVGSIFDDTSRCAFVEERDRLYFTIGLLCSKVCMEYLKIFNPTMSFTNGDINRIPLIFANNYESIDNIVSQNISISKQDWDAHETSWDFETNPLLAVDEETYIDNIHHEIERHGKETGEHICIDPAAPELDSLEWRMEQYKQKWEHLFMQLRENEEELNRQFIDIYGLQDELTPDVPLNEITILQQGEVSFNL
ncbi:MAG: BREX-1 system adenine-specific DNA-methyltransferase PglX [Prevotella sp.]